MQPEPDALLPAPPTVVRASARCRNPLCQRPLRDPDSVALGYGTQCADELGLTPTRPGRLRWAPQTGQGLFEINNEGDGMAKTIEIQGVWLIKATEYNGNGIQVLVQLADGTYREAITDTADGGPICYYVHPAGIEASPVVTFNDGTGVAS